MVKQESLANEVNDVKVKVAVIESTLNRIENNHLSHIEKDIRDLRNKNWMILAGISGQLSATLVAVMMMILQ
tara:strand:- start:1820 stop:2035 length:216 start_codon:yes stop_codon:yes gene_type:complete